MYQYKEGDYGKGKGNIVWKAEVKALPKPQTFGTITKHGQQFYKGEKGKLYEVTAFDKMFKPGR